MQLCRSFLFTPANHAHRVEKALGMPADAVILDLEDAVTVAEKAGARAAAVAAVGRGRASRLYVRVNALRTEWAYADLVATVAAGLDGVVLPEVERADELKTADWLIAALERERGLRPGGIDLMPIIETAAGFVQLEQIAREGIRVRRLAFGAGDFALDVDMAWTRDEQELLPYRSQFAVISRAAGLEPPVDTVWTDLRDMEGLRHSACRARALGFQGKLCIHHSQVPLVNEAFTPDAGSVAHARRVVEAFDQAERGGLASIQLEGRFIDYPIAQAARRIIAQAEALAGKDSDHE